MNEVLQGLKPELVWKHFEAINQIPRCSKNEEGVRNYILDMAKRLNLESKVDETGNVVVKKAGTGSLKDKPIVVVQGHMDMVCEKNKGTEHDFSKDPISFVKTDEGWIKADGTTLGADNGIGLCMGLALLEDESIEHPPLEVLATVDEETGMTGAMGLKSDFLDGKILINLDSEDEGIIYIGCAGGKHTIMTKKIDWEDVPSSMNETVSLKIKGLHGGHSGMEIIKGLGNAIKLISRILYKLSETHDFRLVEVDGGTAHNAIPREADAVLVMDDAALTELGKLADRYQAVFNDELRFVEDKIEVVLDEAPRASRAMSAGMSATVVRLLYGVPHGVMAMSHAVEGLVETSTNLAVVKTRQDEVYMLTSQRSSVATSIIDIADKVAAVGKLAGFKVEQGGGYPAWQPNPDSKILHVCKDVFVKMYGKEPSVEAVHAGLECGIIGEAYDGMDMISFGPDIRGAHSPAERVDPKSVASVWEYLLQVLKAL
ncbi:MAG TPA: aminoacyl-histidine dipeptidase [Caldithrix abyssi]|uniref:Cytosol non-specific dipeptidase n=1 Tax=Caldithrix abyssi TaxID=187145 RepID=A0A7V1LKL2_CALAY|nr:aminoacyl-histidine dipeptidase [Caldithrix abyssi]